VDAAVVVNAGGIDFDLTGQAGGGDVVANCVGHSDAAHGAATVVVEAAKAVEEALAQTPDLAAIGNDRHDKSQVNPAFYFAVDIFVGDDPLEGA
jgi:hypothetical protein